MTEQSAQLYYNGDICTLDPANPNPEALAIRDGSIVAWGSKTSCQTALGTSAQPVDLKGSTLLPGFIDTHAHPFMMIYYDMNVNMRGVHSLDDIRQRLQPQIELLAQDGWLVGLDFDEQEMHDKRFPTRQELDITCPDYPLLLVKHDGHMVLANSRAIEAAGVTPDTPCPEGGEIDRDEHGVPSGAFREMAASLLKNALPLPTPDQLIAGARFTSQRIASKGITSMGAIFQTGTEGPTGESGALETMIMGMLLEHFPINLYSFLFAENLAAIEGVMQSPLHTEIPGGHRVGGLKIIADGSFGSSTALMSAPFSDKPETKGFLLQPAEEIYRRMEFAHRAGLQIAIHAIGDDANRLCLDLYEKLLTAYPRKNHRHRIEHASLLDQQMLTRMKALGLCVSTQPLFVHTEKDWLPVRIGPERCKWVYPFKSIVEAGVPLAGASDAPVEFIDVLHAISCCITREGFETQQALNASQALDLYTNSAAYLQFEEAHKGSLTPGKRADMVVLSENPLKVAAEHIQEIEVQKTIIGGKVIFEA